MSKKMSNPPPTGKRPPPPPAPPNPPSAGYGPERADYHAAWVRQGKEIERLRFVVDAALEWKSKLTDRHGTAAQYLAASEAYERFHSAMDRFLRETTGADTKEAPHSGWCPGCPACWPEGFRETGKDSDLISARCVICGGEHQTFECPKYVETGNGNDSGHRYPHFARVRELLGGDSAKARLWFSTPNPLLGNVSPDEMLEAGRAMRLRKFIDEAERLSGKDCPHPVHQNPGLVAPCPECGADDSLPEKISDS